MFANPYAIIDIDLSNAWSDAIVIVEWQAPNAEPTKSEINIRWSDRMCLAAGDVPDEVLEAVEHKCQEHARQDRAQQIADCRQAIEEIS